MPVISNYLLRSTESLQVVSLRPRQSTRGEIHDTSTSATVNVNLAVEGRVPCTALGHDKICGNIIESR